MDHVMQLVADIYTPGVANSTINKAQIQLKQLQKSPQGWELAKLLLTTSDANAQFIGAQTFTVQLNDGNYLPNTNQIHDDLLQCLSFSLQSNYASFVIRKLLSAITKVYLRSSDWADCPSQVLDLLNSNTDLVLEFLSYLIEDSELTAPQLREKLVPDVSNLVLNVLMSVSLNNEMALNVFGLWCDKFFDQFKVCLPQVMLLMMPSSLPNTGGNTTNGNNDTNGGNGGRSDIEVDEDVKISASVVLRDLYTSNLKNWDYNLKSQLKQVLLQLTTLQYDIEDDWFIGLSELIIDVCEQNFEENVELHYFIMKLAGLSIPVVNDRLASAVLDFWNSYVEEVVSMGLSKSSIEIIEPVIQSYWPRIKIYDQLSISDWNEFASFRRDFADFLELSYQIIGNSLFEHLTNVILLNLGNGTPDWYEIESAMFCLNGLADIIGEDYQGERPEFQSIRMIFQSSLWQKLPECLSMRVRQTAVNLIGSFVDFFKSSEGQPFLALTLNYLFTSLEIPSLQNSASKSIRSLCDSSRQLLVNEIDTFLMVYQQVRDGLESVCHVRAVSAISFVIQAMKPLEKQTEAATRLLNLVCEERGIAEPSPSDKVDANQVLVTKLSCIAAIGKSLQLPDLKSELYQSDEYINFYSTSTLVADFKARLQYFILQSLDSQDVMVIESVCEILKSGIPEPFGLFVFGTQFILEYITLKGMRGPPITLSPLVNLARVLLLTECSKFKKDSTTSLFPLVVSELMKLIVSQGQVNNNTSPCLDLLVQIAQSMSKLNQPMSSIIGSNEAIYAVALPGIDSHDRFILKSAGSFWKEFLNSEVQLDHQMLGQLINSVLKQISGQASRSDLHTVTDVLKVLLNKHYMESYGWINLVVAESPTIKTIARQPEQTKKVFLQSLSLVKGSKKLEDVVMKFWLACRNIPESYNPHSLIS